MAKVSVETSEAGLIRGIRRWDLVAIAINGIIGAGIFGLPSKVFSLIGTYSLTAFAANCNLLVNYLGYFLPSAANPVWRASIITIVVAILTTINVLGVRQAAIVSNVFTIGKLIPIIIFI